MKDQLRQACDKTIQHLELQYSQLQVGRASTGLVENIDIYIPDRGMNQKLNQVGNITIMDPQTIKIEPWDKSTISHIEKGIYDAGLGFSPLNQGDYILIKIPPLTEERRRDLTKIVSKEGEEAKISIRNHRHELMRKLKHQLEEKEISENEKNSTENAIDEITKEYNTKVEDMVKNKSNEIMTI